MNRTKYSIKKYKFDLMRRSHISQQDTLLNGPNGGRIRGCPQYPSVKEPPLSKRPKFHKLHQAIHTTVIYLFMDMQSASGSAHPIVLLHCLHCPDNGHTYLSLSGSK